MGNAALQFSRIRRANGFTLVELLIAMVITAVILTCVSGLSLAMTTACRDSEVIQNRQMMLRTTNLRLQDLVKNCKMVCGASDNEIVLWVDDKNGDNSINPFELAYVVAGSDRRGIKLVTFGGTGWQANTEVSRLFVESDSSLDFFISNCDETIVDLFVDAKDVVFRYDRAAPDTRFLSICFGVAGSDEEYEVAAALRADIGNILSSSHELPAGDDDLW